MSQGERLPQELELRRLRYRLQRLGMLELEAWLGRLKPALEAGDGQVAQAAQQLMAMETPHLLAMMHAEVPLPAALRPWLEVKAP